MSVPAMEPEGVLGPGAERAPDRIVAVRLAAFGDAALALSALNCLRRYRPSTRIEVVTDPANADLFRAHEAIDTVWPFDSMAPRWRRALAVTRLARDLGSNYALADLQRCRWSTILRRIARPDSWVAFDRFAPEPALGRYLEALGRLGFGPIPLVLESRLRNTVVAEAVARIRAAEPDGRLLLGLNPAGSWPTRQWPLERWTALGTCMNGVRLVLAAAPGARGDRVRELAARLPQAWLIDDTPVPVVAAIVAQFWAMVSEDSGLGHLAWSQGVRTVALFGATRATWTAPDPTVGVTFASEDLPCGACMANTCARGDVHCLDRIRVDDVLEALDAEPSLYHDSKPH